MKLPVLNLLRQPSVLVTGAAAIALAVAWRRFFRPYQTTGGPIILLLMNGTLLRAERLLYPPGPDQRLSYRRIGTAPGDGPEDFDTATLSLAPSEAVFAIGLVESFSDGVDGIVAVRSASQDETLFSGTDNTIAPATVWRGDDPAAPSWLLAAQASRDAEWQTWLEDDPTIPRPIVEGWFYDVSTDGDAGAEGWTAAGELRIGGATRPSFRMGDESWWGDDLQPWWAVVAPTATGAWAILDRGHGSIPATWPAVPVPARVLDVSVNAAGQLLVDGVIQTSPMLDDVVVSFDGPFS